MHFLFPADPLSPRATDPLFAPQRRALEDAGFTASLCPDEALDGDRPLRGIPEGATVVYRGWMLNAERYGRLTDAVARAGAEPLTSPDAYLATHHLPRWYPLLAGLTPETRVLDPDADLPGALRALGWDAFFVKDYVKSLKTSVGSVVRDPAQIGTVVSEMRRFRGEIEGGVCVRRVEAFLPETERRCFVLRGASFAADGGAVPEPVRVAAECIPSPFFSVDVVRREDGALRIVEIGDGQVSDLVGWTPEAFAAMWVPTTADQAAPG